MCPQKTFGKHVAMINDKTVLILGAGTSTPYGYPDGEELIDAILDCVAKRETIDKIANNFNKIPDVVWLVAQKIEGELKEHRPSSIVLQYR